MTDIRIIKNPKVESKFQNYPDEVRRKLEILRDLIIATANEMEHIREIEETLKWDEPSYLVEKGSTIRIDWKAKTPDQYAIYFTCTSQLIPNFKKVYGDLFEYENNRAILFKLNDEIPIKELKDCIAVALKYHLVKKKTNLDLSQRFTIG